MEAIGISVSEEVEDDVLVVDDDTLVVPMMVELELLVLVNILLDVMDERSVEVIGASASETVGDEVPAEDDGISDVVDGTKVEVMGISVSEVVEDDVLVVNDVTLVVPVMVELEPLVLVEILLANGVGSFVVVGD